MTISKLPVVRPIMKVFRYWRLCSQNRSSENAIIQQLSEQDCPRAKLIAELLREIYEPLPESEKTVIKKIESQRRLMLKRQDPLVDGTLGEGGLYDKDVTTRSACKVSKPPKSALFMYRLIRKMKPKVILELGTNVGISSAFQAAALKVNQEGGKLITLEASPYRIRLARQLHQSLGLDNVSYVQGLFTDTLEPTLSGLDPVDFAFIDGHHQYQPTLDYFSMIYKQAQPSAFYVFDDIRWSDGMKRAWSEIQEDERLGLVVDLNSMGVCVGSYEDTSTRYSTQPIILPLTQIF